MSINVNANIVLRLNANFQRIGFATIAESFVGLCGDQNAYCGLDISYNEIYEDTGLPNYDSEPIFYVVPNFEEWKNLPIRPWDLSVSSSKLKFRVPSVIIAINFRKTILKQLRPTPTAIKKRDNMTCQLSGKRLNNSEASIEHLQPKSKGGKNSWKNLILADKKLNSLKSDMSLDEFTRKTGYKLIRQPSEPKAVPLSCLITENKLPEHKLFP